MRDRDRDETERKKERVKQRDTERERDRERDRQTETDTERERLKELTQEVTVVDASLLQLWVVPAVVARPCKDAVPVGHQHGVGSHLGPLQPRPDLVGWRRGLQQIGRAHV